MLLNKAKHMGKVLLRFAGEANHQRGAEHELRCMPGHIIQHVPDMRLIAAPIHAAEYLILSVLQGHIQIGQHLSAGPEAIDELRRDRIGIGIEHTNPMQGIDLLQT
ncbi:hypothetical protein SDC9_158498 [bioreactor metagenome]|uniref:Uncharacterized protein n=1 Tax=bioreactor metagenome TaxID=1076179 RepID=A0A645FAB4_9ZZZZ